MKCLDELLDRSALESNYVPSARHFAMKNTTIIIKRNVSGIPLVFKHIVILPLA